MKFICKCILFTVFISTVYVEKLQACASFLADPKNNRSGGSVKHFFSTRTENRNLIIKNETNEKCVIRLEVLDIIQRLDGGYQYVKFDPKRALSKSLAPYLSVLSENNDELLWNEITLLPKQIIVTRIGIAEESLNAGTYSAAIRAFFPEGLSNLLLTEIYFSKENYQAPELILKNLKYNVEKQTVDFLLKGEGLYYSFLYFDIKLLDPITGFEVAGFNTSSGKFKPFRAYIKNYWVPGTNDQRLIKGKFSLADFNNVFKSKFTERFPDTDWDNQKWVLSIKTKYAIDVDGWENHYYLSLPMKTLEITN